MNIYVGNLPFSITEDGLRKMFEPYGQIESAKLITDRETGRTRGFGFVEMDNAGADAAIKALNKTELDGRILKVNQAEPKKAGGMSARRRW
ncbi:MAG: RNA-binding protein [Nitrospinota bacterium]|nr:RNA-binding protein [Nitrospinota bacterium]MDH4183821.1 RNA-binding protein [Nitrospinota bacterium]